MLFIATNLKTPCVSKRDEDFLSAKSEDKRIESRLKLEDTPTVRSGSFIMLVRLDSMRAIKSLKYFTQISKSCLLT